MKTTIIVVLTILAMGCYEQNSGNMNQCVWSINKFTGNQQLCCYNSKTKALQCIAEGESFEREGLANEQR